MEQKFESSIDFYISRISGTSRVIYLTVVAILILLLVSMGMVKIRLSMSARGILRPEVEQSQLRAILPGKVDEIFVREGSPVLSGDTLILLDNRKLEESLKNCLMRMEELRQKTKELRYLQQGQYTKIRTQELLSEFRKFDDQVKSIELRLGKARKERIRMESLYGEKLISEKEYDDLYYNERLLEKELKVTKSGFAAKWQEMLEACTLELREQHVNTERIRTDIRNNAFISPVNGTIEQFSGIYRGSPVMANQLLVTISPDTNLVSEIYVPASKIGLLRSGQQARILIDAFNYREWGTITTSISEISNDVIYLDQVPVFRIRCNLNTNELTLKNGIQGSLKQGMTCTARIFMNKRTILQIIFDRADKWLRPVEENN